MNYGEAIENALKNACKSGSLMSATWWTENGKLNAKFVTEDFPFGDLLEGVRMLAAWCAEEITKSGSDVDEANGEILKALVGVIEAFTGRIKETEPEPLPRAYPRIPKVFRGGLEMTKPGNDDAQKDKIVAEDKRTESGLPESDSME